jgi:hypothetical protein
MNIGWNRALREPSKVFAEKAPLFCKGPSKGSALFKSPVWWKLQVPSLPKL